MAEARWLRWFGPGAVVLGALGFIASATLGAGGRAWTPALCVRPAVDLLAAARDPGAATLADLRGAPWFRLDPLLDGDGALIGQRLDLGIEGDRSARSVRLPAEGFAAGPFGRIILAGSDDGTTSRLQAIDQSNECAWTIDQSTSVIRRASIDPAGAFLYEIRVARGTRADLGTWRRSVAGRGEAVRVLAPIPADQRFGRTFSTEFGWDPSGDRLAVQSCGEVACRTRIIALRGGATTTIDAPDLGLLVGLDGDRVVTYEACRGLPCPIVSTDLRTGDRQVLAPAGGRAILVRTPGGSRLVHEVGATAGRMLRAVTLDGGIAADLGPLPAGTRLHPAAVQADAATRLPIGWVLLSPDGRLPATGSSDRPQLRHVPDGSTVMLDEVLR